MTPVPGEHHDTHPNCHPGNPRPAWDGIATRHLAALVERLDLPTDAHPGRIANALKSIGTRSPDRQTNDDIRDYRRGWTPLPPQSRTVTAPPTPEPPPAPPTTPPPPPRQINAHRQPRTHAIDQIRHTLTDPHQLVLVAPSGYAGTVARWLTGQPWEAWIADGTHDKPWPEALWTTDPQVVVAADILESAAVGESRWVGVWAIFILPTGTPVRAAIGHTCTLLKHPDRPRLALVCDDPDDPPGWPRLVLQALAKRTS